MEKVIYKALENGWKYKNKEVMNVNLEDAEEQGYFFLDTKTHTYSVHFEEVWLDPLFWQSLGKGLEWSESKSCLVCNGEQTHSVPEWHYRWARFIDHLASGKSADSFFDELLK